MQNVLGLVLVLLASASHGYRSGAPSSACTSLKPWHSGMQAIEGHSPYTINATPSVAPGGEVEVEISGGLFKGYMVQAMQGNEIIGQFQDTNLVSCKNSMDTATHHGRNNKQYTKFRWTAPQQLTGGPIYIRGTILKQYTTAYLNVSSNAISVY